MDRQDPFADLPEEPVNALPLIPKVLTQRQGGGRRTPLRPSEKRRRGRKVTITFQESETVERLRNLARQWGLKSPSGEPNVSEVVERLLLPQLEAALQQSTTQGIWQ